MLQSVLHLLMVPINIINKIIINSPLTRINILILYIPMAYFLINGAPINITNINATKNEISSVIYPASTKPGNISGMSSDHKYLVSIVATTNIIIMKRIIIY